MTSRTIHPARPAFTLIELLVVMGIILALASLTLVIGGRVLDSRKAATTEQMVTGLDGILEMYVQDRRGAMPPPPGPEWWINDNGQAPQNNGWDDLTSGFAEITNRYGGAAVSDVTVDNDITPVTDQDPVTGEREYIRPTSGLFTYQVRGSSGADEALGRFPSTQLAPIRATGMVAVIDAWGDAKEPQYRHILYVHPSNQRAQQLYGFCQNGRPYFLSAGPDGIYGSVHDLPNKTARNELRRYGTAQAGPYRTWDGERVAKFFREAKADNVASYPVRETPVVTGADLQLNPER